MIRMVRRFRSDSCMKTCFKCNISKPLSEFYSHPRMADGHLNKCKVCTCKDTAARNAIKSKDPEWVESELARHRTKTAKYRALGTKCKNKASSVAKWNAANKSKSLAHGKVQRAVLSNTLIRKPCEVCGAEKAHAHHDDYTKPLDVKWLCPKHHGERHVELNRIKRQQKYTDL